MTDFVMASCQIHASGESCWFWFQHLTHHLPDGMAPNLRLYQFDQRLANVPYPKYGNDSEKNFQLLERSSRKNLMERNKILHHFGQMKKLQLQLELHSYDCWLYEIQTS